jgi:hypothetical protein
MKSPNCRRQMHSFVCISSVPHSKPHSPASIPTIQRPIIITVDRSRALLPGWTTLSRSRRAPRDRRRRSKIRGQRDARARPRAHGTRSFSWTATRPTARQGGRGVARPPRAAACGWHASRATRHQPPPPGRLDRERPRTTPLAPSFRPMIPPPHTPPPVLMR